MAKLSFKQLPGEQLSLFPENIYDKIPPNHPVRLIDKIVDKLDISFVLPTYRGGGNSAYPPRIMLKILFFAYFNNIYSSRKIEKALHENIYFMWIARHATPNFRTINNFRSKRLKGHIDKLFAEVVKMLNQMGYVSLKKQYVDGTVIEAAANRYTFVWRRSVEKNKAKLEEKIQAVLDEIHQQMRLDELENEGKLPEKIDTEALEKHIAKINEQLKKKPAPNHEKTLKKNIKKLKDKYVPRLNKYEEQLRTLGDRNSYSKTDPDATFMRTKDDHFGNGQLKPAYNIQVSSENQFITHYSIHQKTTDTTCLIPHLEGFKRNYGQQSREIIADAGYGSEENYEYLEAERVEAYIKYNTFEKERKRSWAKNIFHPSRLYYNAQEDYYVCPMGQKMRKIKEGKRVSAHGYVSHVSYYEAQNCRACPLKSGCFKGRGNRIIEVNHRLNQLRRKAKERLESERGLYHRRKRGVEVESVFGQLKQNNKFRRFILRGLENVEIEFGLMAIGHNLRKLMAQIAGYLPGNPIKKLENRLLKYLHEVFLIKEQLLTLTA